MSTINIKIKNIKEIKSAFNKAPALMARGLNKAIKKSVINIEAKSRLNTPVLTGTLQRSHRSQFAPLRGEVGTHTNYDMYVHDGTRYMKARPYLYNAVQSEEQDTDKFFMEAVESVLSEIARAT